MLKVGVFSFTCCEGCVMVLIEALNKRYDQWLEKIEFDNFRAIKKVKPMEKMDLALVEGAITNKHESKKLKEIRKNTTTLIALGSGASNGYPSNQRNNLSIEMKKQIKPELKKLKQYKTIEPLEKYVKVDDKINGCPIDINELTKKIDTLLENA